MTDLKIIVERLKKIPKNDQVTIKPNKVAFDLAKELIVTFKEINISPRDVVPLDAGGICFSFNAIRALGTIEVYNNGDVIFSESTEETFVTVPGATSSESVKKFIKLLKVTRKD
jgi:hypothetical protein